MTPCRAAFYYFFAFALLPLARSAEPVPVPTVIESGAAEMISTETETTFSFTKGVTVTATNMTLTCEDLVVVATRTGDPKATLGNQQGFKSLIATGGVRIVQNDREATAARAEVFPGDDKVILSGDPIVRNIGEGTELSGKGMQLVLYRGQRRAVIEGPQGTRVRLTGPSLKDLGFDPEKEKEKAKAAPKAGPERTPAEPTIRVPIPNLPR